MKQNVDFEFIPHEDDKWAIRMLQGDYVETVWMFDELELQDDGMLHYNVVINSTPDPHLTEEDMDFQSMTGEVLIEVLHEVVSDGSGGVGEDNAI